MMDACDSECHRPIMGLRRHFWICAGRARYTHACLPLSLVVSLVRMQEGTWPMYPMEGVTSQPQAVTTGRPTQVNTGKLLSQATRDDTRE